MKHELTRQVRMCVHVGRQVLYYGLHMCITGAMRVTCYGCYALLCVLKHKRTICVLGVLQEYHSKTHLRKGVGKVAHSSEGLNPQAGIHSCGMGHVCWE